MTPEVPSEATVAEATPIHVEDREGVEARSRVTGHPAFKRIGDRLFWTCAVCGTENEIEAEICSSCGTPFERIFEPAPGSSRVAANPGSVAARSLLFPGAGHISIGRTAEGLARVLLFIWTASMSVAMFVLGRGPGATNLAPLGALYVVAAVVVYAGTAVDAYRAAAGRPPLLPPRAIVLGAAGLILLTVVVALILGVRVAG